MRKFANLLILLSIMAFSTAHADSSMAKMRLNINNAGNHFVCVYGTGCLRILPGKTYPILHGIDLHNIFVLNRSNRRLTAQAASSSCNLKVERGQTVTISGSLNSNGRITGLHCSVH